MRNGKDYVASLRDGRAIFLDDGRVEDVTTHPAFVEPIRRIAGIYEVAREEANLPITSYLDPQTGRRYSTKWLIPRTAEDLTARRRLHRFWAEPSYGHMGRTPDHVACLISAYAGSADFFARGGSHFAENVGRFYERAREEDLYVAYTIVPPQVDRSKPAHKQPEPFLYPGVVKERDGGIVVRGAQMIGTSAVMADWIFMSYITPLSPGDEDYAIAVVLPANAPGLRMYARRPYSTIATSVYDYPLSSRFDETDSLIVMNDVFVPWEQVFIYRNVELVNGQFNETGSHVLCNFQSLVRFGAKLDFLAGLAYKLAELHSIEGLPPVQSTLGGEIGALCATFEALVHAAESFPVIKGGLARPGPQYIYTGMSLQRKLVIEMMRTLRELAGGAFLSVPSSGKAFEGEETAADVARYYKSATASAEQRVKILKLIWDFVGTEFAGRQLQYEMFYSAAQHVVDGRVFRTYDWSKGRAMVDRCLKEY
jgi:4-hydroxyphenylacetate 3-monooxygenase